MHIFYKAHYQARKPTTYSPPPKREKEDLFSAFENLNINNNTILINFISVRQKLQSCRLQRHSPRKTELIQLLANELVCHRLRKYICHLTKDVCPEYIKNWHIHNKKTNNLILKMGERLEQTLHKRKPEWPWNTWKISNTSHQGNGNENHRKGTISHPL